MQADLKTEFPEPPFDTEEIWIDIGWLTERGASNRLVSAVRETLGTGELTPSQLISSDLDEALEVTAWVLDRAEPRLANWLAADLVKRVEPLYRTVSNDDHVERVVADARAMLRREGEQAELRHELEEAHRLAVDAAREAEREDPREDAAHQPAKPAEDATMWEVEESSWEDNNVKLAVAVGAVKLARAVLDGTEGALAECSDTGIKAVRDTVLGEAWNAATSGGPESPDVARKMLKQKRREERAWQREYLKRRLG